MFRFNCLESIYRIYTIQLAIALLEHYSYVTILWDIAISISDSIYYTHYFGGILEVFEGQPGGGKEGG